ncbi:MAG: glycosyltransferase, partial [Alphaproteobacteria bacterium]|nr:glycosyltransferase [Alphaproteobacteria bacterium]
RPVQELASLPGVEVTGSVPDVRPYVRRSAVMVAPLSIARGTQNKILEAMAMGVPVVTSSIGARGVDAVPGEHLIVADGAEATAQAVCHLLGHPEERRRLSQAGRARVRSHHDWEGAMARMDRIVAERLGNSLAAWAA